MELKRGRGIIGAANIWKRIAAFVIDLAVLSIFVLAPFEIVIRRVLPAMPLKEAFSFELWPEQRAVLFLASIFMVIVIYLYFLVLEYKIGQSIGKKVMNIYVVSEDKKKTLWRYFARNLFLFPFFPFILLWFIDPLFMLFTKDNRRLCEILSKTKTVEVYPYKVV